MTLSKEARKAAKHYNMSHKHVTAPDSFVKRTFGDGFNSGYAFRSKEVEGLVELAKRIVESEDYYKGKPNKAIDIIDELKDAFSKLGVGNG